MAVANGLVRGTKRSKAIGKCEAERQLASIDGDATTGLSASWITRPSIEI